MSMPRDRVVLRPARPRLIGLLLLCAGFAAAGAWMAREGEATGWLGVGFFGPGIPIFATLMLPGASYLALSDEGFELCSLYRRRHYRWEDVERFDVGWLGPNRAVVFDFSASRGPDTRVRAWNRALAGCEASLPDTYGMPVDALAALLNEWRHRSPRAVQPRPCP